MNDLYTVRRAGKQTVVEFQTPSLMNPQELERVGSSLLGMVEGQDAGKFVLDFSKVKYLSSQAIGIILTLNKKLTGGSAGGENLVLCGVGPQLMQLLKITRLDRILTIKSTPPDAGVK